NQYDRGNSEYVRIRFDEYNKQFDLSTLGFSNRTADSVNKNSERVLSIRQLSKAIDSLKKEIDKTSEQTVNNMFRQVRFAGVLDSQWRKPVADSIGTKSQFKDMDELLPDSAKANVYQSAQNIAASMKINAEGYVNVLKEKNKVLRKHKIEWHRKIVLSLACVVLFLVGAPLGSIIRKGGLGTPLIFAIVFFMVFYFSSTTGEKFAKENTFTPFTGMWLATFVLLPIGLFLTYKAMHDSQLFNKEFYTRLKRSVKRIWNKSRNK
ncbi:MAG TPA: LptF/LptG family permease, partial [Chitinophagaceae bacterium]|nr:LptF/LptG family permease [Chitinophagaceae bacterium]